MLFYCIHNNYNYIVEAWLTDVICWQCVKSLEQELSAQQFNTWIRPLTSSLDQATGDFCLTAPNRFIADWVNDKFMQRINELVFHYFSNAAITPPVSISIRVAARIKAAFENNYSITEPAPGRPVAVDQSATNNKIDRNGTIQATDFPSSINTSWFESIKSTSPGYS